MESAEGPVVESLKTETMIQGSVLDPSKENQQADEIPDVNHLIKDENATAQNNDPYAYLEKAGFTSEKFKIEIRNLPKYYGLSELKKLLNNKLKLGSNKVKASFRNSSWLYVCFRSEEDKLKAIEKLNGFTWKGKVLKADTASAVPDPLVKKRMHNDREQQGNKKLKINEGSLSEQLKDATTPLWRLPYKEQLEKKTELITDTLKKFARQLKDVNPNIADWLSEQTKKYNGLPCEVWPIRYSELSEEGYRNKCEFSIGINEVTKEKTVGFRLGSYATGSVCVAPIDDIPTVPDRMKIAVLAFQEFVRNSKLDVFNPETHEGYWRQLTSRYGFKTDQLMLVIGIHPQNLLESELNQLKEEIKNYFTTGDGETCNVTSLFLQLIEKRKSQNDEPVYHHILGETYIQERLLNKLFRISPQAFFQINTNAAEVLYNSIAELSGLTKENTLLDVCCGTGSIGICLADKCDEVLGLEISPQAVADAEENASVNNVQNAKFFEGKAEEILSSVAHRASKSDVVAIVDPPRAGLHHNALVQLRKTKQINKLVYVSCEPKLALKNFVDLGRSESKMYQRGPFLPVKAVPVDLFPHTNHCELLIYFERQPDDAS